MKIRVPVRIKPGDTIGIVAPAGPFDRQTFFRGVRIIEDMGFKIFIPRVYLKKIVILPVLINIGSNL